MMELLGGFSWWWHRNTNAPRLAVELSAAPLLCPGPTLPPSLSSGLRSLCSLPKRLTTVAHRRAEFLRPSPSVDTRGLRCAGRGEEWKRLTAATHRRAEFLRPSPSVPVRGLRCGGACGEEGGVAGGRGGRGVGERGGGWAGGRERVE